MKKGVMSVSLILFAILFASLSFVSACSINYCSYLAGCSSCSTSSCSYWNAASGHPGYDQCICYVSCSNSVPGWSPGLYGNVAPYVPPACTTSKTCADYPNQCGTKSNGCTNSLNCTCASGSTCTSGVCTPNIIVNTTYWANLNGQNISSAGINDSVFMMAPGMGFDGKFINYTIYKRGSLTTWNPLNWFTHTILQTSSLGISDWLVEDTGSYFFKVKIEGVENESGNLDVAGHINTIPQTSIILSPTTNYAAVNYSINFSHSSSDEDDMLNLFWDFGDGENYTYYNYSFLSYGSGGAGHSYDAAGIYTVRLTASEKGRNQGATATKTIYVLQPGINAVPVITSPNESQVYENRVGFNASQSFVANCTHGPMAGAFVVGDLNCSYIHAPGKRSIIENYDLKLNWTIRDNNNGVSFSRYGTWKNNYTSAVEYWWYFEDEGERTALLIMNYSAP